jgi:uncharacterized protein (TIGR00369 family)
LTDKPPLPGLAELQAMLDAHEFTTAYGFQVVAVGGGEATIRVPYLERWVRPGGIVSGPVYMSAADCAMWVAIIGNHGWGPMAVTTELNTSFIGAAREEEITCKARILKNGRRLIYGLADCYGADGRPLTHHMITYARADS